MTAPPTAPPTTANKPRRSTVGVFSKRKGVRYRQDGAVLTCRFCEILRRRDEPFLYEDAQVVVFRPLRPIVPSHVLIVPRAHIRNVTMLEASHEPLLRQMKLVAERVLLSMPQSSPSPGIDEASAAVVNSPCPSGSETPVALGDSKRSEESSHCTDDEDSCSPRQNSNNNNGISTNKPRALKLSFHVPPFNSIDHVHMHGFHDAPRRMGVFGRLKYKTESWWCRSYDDVLVRLTSGSEAPGCKLESRDDELAPCGPVVDQDATTSVY
ncbi:Histidine triad nucleotide-binding protein 3 [Globisporangium polare]